MSVVRSDLASVGEKTEAKGDFKVTKETKGVVSLTLAGKPTVARFEVSRPAWMAEVAKTVVAIGVGFG